MALLRLAIFAACVLALAQGQIDKGDGFNAYLSRAIKVTRSNSWTTLKGYATATPAFTLPGFNPSTGVYTAPKSGVYWISSQATLQSANTNYLRLLVAINNLYNVHNSMHCIKSFAKWNQYSLHVNGFLYLSEGDTILASVYSRSDSSFTIQTTSSFSAWYMGPVYQHIGFSADLWGSRTYRKRGWYEITGYSTTAYTYLWNNGQNTFNTGNGRFTAPCSGVYYVAANVRMDSSTGSYFRLIAAVNGSKNTNAGLASIEGQPTAPYYTQNVGGSIYLNEGDWISLWIFSATDDYFVAQSESSFHVMFLGPRNQIQPSFMADFNVPKTLNAGSTRLSGWRITGANGLFDTNSFNEATGYFTAPFTGKYAASAMVRLNNAKGNNYIYIRTSSRSDNGLSTRTGRQWSTTRAMDAFTLKSSAVLSLTRGQTVSVYVYSQISRAQVGSESSFSMSFLGPNSPHPGLHADIASNIRVTNKTTWVQVTKWNNNYSPSTGLYSVDASWDGSQYLANAPGIYYVGCNLRLDYTTKGVITKAAIAVNGVPSANNGLHAIDTVANAFVTYTISGFVKLRAGDSVSVWSNSEDDSYDQSTGSGFSVNRMGSEFDRPSFLADLGANITVPGTAWTKLTNWDTQVGSGTFKSSYSFSEATGDFTAPYTGKYIVMANVRFDNVPINGVYTMIIAINGNTGNVDNGVKSVRGTKSITAAKRIAFTETVQGVLSLTKGQKISVMVQGSVGPFTINEESGFSACFVPGTPYGFQADLVRSYTFPSSTRSSYRDLAGTYSFSSRTNTGLWSTSTSQRSSYITLPADGTGVYILSANVQFDNAVGNNFRVMVSIDGSTNGNNGLVSMQGTPVTSSFSQQVVGTAFLRGGSNIRLKIYNTGAGAFTINTATGFSAVLVSGTQYARPSFLADVAASVSQTSTGWKQISNYVTHSTQSWTWGLHKFGNGTLNNGVYTVPQTGIYWVMGNARLNGAVGRYTRLVVAVNSVPSLQGGLHSVTGVPSATYYTMHVAGAAYLTAGQKIAMWVYSNSDPTYQIDTESTFSVFYIGGYGQIPGFMIDMSRNSGYTSVGYRTPTTWQSTTDKSLWSSQSFGLGKLNLGTGTFTVPFSGVYLVSANLRLDQASTGYFRTFVSVNGSRSSTDPALSAAKSGSLHRNYHTTNVFGALQLPAQSTIQLVTQSTTDTRWYFQHESGWSAAYIAPMNQVRGMSVKRLGTSTITRARQWYEVWSWGTTGNGFFADEFMSLRTGRYTTQAGGKYYVSMNIRFNNVDSGYIYAKVLINRNLAGRARLTALMSDQVQGGAPNTLSMSGVLYLPPFAQISMGIYASTDSNYQLDGDSTYSVVYLGTSDNPECQKGGPVMAVDPLATQVLVGDPLVLTCRALSVPPPKYSWYFAGQLLSGQNTNTLSLVASNSLAGLFQCAATANGRTVRSATATVTVFGHDGTIPGFCADILVAGLSQTRANTWITVTQWRTNSASQVNLYDTGNFNENTGVFTVPLSGVYIVSLNLRLDSISGDGAQAVVSINNGNGIDNGMSSSWGYPTTWQTLNVNAAIYLKKRQTIRVKAFSQTDTSWVIQGESGFSARYLAPLQSVPGTMWEMGADIQRQKVGWFEVTGWRAIWGQTVGTGSYNQLGRFKAPCDGVYYVASNIRVENANGRYFRSIVAVNGKTDVSNGLHSIQGAPVRSNYFTMSVVGVVQLTKGQNLSAMIYSYDDSSYSIDTASSMSIAYLSPASNAVPGFHADLAGDRSFRSINKWEVIKGWRTSGTAGLFASSADFNAATGVFTAQTAGIYHVSGLVRLDGASGRYFRLAVNINNQPTLHNGLHSIRGYPPSTYYTLTVSGSVPLEAGHTLSLIVLSNTDNNWRVQHESGFSVYLLERISPGFHSELAKNLPQASTSWVRLGNWRTNPGKSDGLFQTGTQFNPTTGLYTVSAPGIYYVAANVRFDSATSGQVLMSIAVNNDYTINNGLHVKESYLPKTNQQFSLRVSGFVHCQVGDTVSVYIRSTVDKAFSVQTESGFSMAYIAPPLSIPAFLADYSRNSKYTKTGWFELTGPWRVSGANSLFISGGQAFDRTKGRFTAPAIGTYWVVANVMLTGLTSSGANLHAAIAVNGLYNVTSGLHAMRSATPASSIFTLMVSGALHLNTGDYLSVYVGSDRQTNWGVSSQTGFSVAFIGTKLLQGFSSWGPALTRKNTGWIRQTGFQTTGFPGLFNTFGAPPNNGLWTVPQSGWYFVAANHHITGGSGFMRSLIGISLSLTPNNGLHSAQGNPTNEMSPSVAGVVRLRKGQTLSNHFYSATDKNYAYSTQGFSVAEISRYHALPSFHAFRWGVKVTATGWYTVRGYNTNAYQWTYDMQTGAFNNGNGVFTAIVAGVYWVSGNVELRDASGRYFRLVVSINGQNSIQGGLHSVTGPPTTNLYTLSVSGSLYMNTGDTASLAVYSNTDLNYNINRAQFAMHFVEYPTASLGFSVDQTAGVRVGKLAWTSPGAWRVYPNNGLYVNGTGLNLANGIYTAPYDGIYLVALNARVDSANTGYFRVKVAVNGSSTKEYGMTVSKTGATHGSYYTLNLVNALFLYAGTKLQPLGWSQSDTVWYFQQESGWNSVYLASRSEVQAVHAKLAANITMGSGSRRIQGWTTMGGVSPFMSDRSFDERTGIFTALTAGNYFVSFNIRVDGISSGPVAVQFRINGGQPAAIHAYEGLPVSKATDISVNTLSASGIIRMKRFQKLTVWVSFVTDTSFKVVDESSMSVVFMGGSDPERCPLTGVTITQQPVGGTVAVGDKFSFSCVAVANAAIVYQWNFNGRPISQANTMWYNITKVTTSNRGWYRCDATSGSDKATGIGAYLDVYNPFPVFKPPAYNADIFENVPKGRSILKVFATAETMAHKNQPVKYRITSGNDNSFVINANTGVISRGNRNLDRERTSFYTLTVRATSTAKATYFTDVKVNVTVVDLNDNRPVFVPKDQYVAVAENAPVTFVVATLSSTDRDLGSNTQVAYNITGGNGRGFFGVSGNQVTVVNPLDRDFTTRNLTIKLFFVAYNPVVPGPNGFGSVSINILDINDNSPIFVKPVYNLNVSEAAGQNTWLTRVRATDRDYGTNGTVTYAIIGGNGDGNFRIDGTLGILRLANTLDYDTVSSYSLTVQARDGGTPGHSANVMVNVMVENANDNIPLFTLPYYFGTTTENLPAGQSIVTVFATDKDKHAFTYSTSNANFTISSAGLISTAGPLDREAGNPFVFNIYAIDVVPAGQSHHTGTAVVSVDIIDVNDNTPAFTKPTYAFTVPETIAVGAIAGQVMANDPDADSFGLVTYSIPPTLDPFFIQPGTGIIETTAALNFVAKSTYTFTVTATDGGGLSSSATVTVNVQNVNLYAPYFGNVTYSATIAENVANLTAVVQVTATDIDQKTGLTYSIVHGGNGRFSINPTTGQIRTNGPIDYEMQPGYELVVACNDNGTPPMQNITFVFVQITDLNDNPPIFAPPKDSAGISQLAPAGTLIYVARATDADSGINAMITYTLSGTHANLFNISKTNGTVYLAQDASKFGGTSISVQVTATDGPNSAALQLTDNILPPNGDLPQFALDIFKFYAVEDITTGTTVGSCLAYVAALGNSGSVSYSVSTNNAFTINPTTGVLYTTATLDREATDNYALTLTATVGEGLSAVSSTSQVLITVTDVNDNPPVFMNKTYLARVPEADPAGSPIFKLVASDPDSGFNAAIRYSIVTGGDGVFQIDPFLGTIYTTQRLNPKVKSLYPMTVAATNPTLFPLTTTTKLNVLVVEINDHTPLLTHPTYNFNVKENSLPGTFIGTIMGTDVDSGVFGQLTYRLLPSINSAVFSINANNGTITLKGPVDRERQRLYGFQARVTDGGGLFDQARVLVAIDDVNDNPPVLNPSKYAVHISQGVPQGTGVVALRATDRDTGLNGAQGFQYSIDPTTNTNSRFAIDKSTGIISVLNPLNAPPPPPTLYLLSVTVSDSGVPPMSATGTVNVTTYAVGLATPRFTFPSYTVSVNSPVVKGTTVLTVSATGNGTLFYTIATTNIPFAVDRNTGVITARWQIINADNGINNWIFTVRATDRNGLVGFATIHVNLIHVNEYAPVFQPLNQQTAITENSPPGTTVIQMKATDRDDGSDGVVTYSVLGGNGFTINPTTGYVTVSPFTTIDREARATYNLVIKATDGGTPSPLTATSSLLITVNDVNDNPPIFTATIYNATVVENLPAGSFVSVVRATDADIGSNANVTYMLSRTNSIFTMNPLTGVINTLIPLDRESTPYYELTVTATDGKYTATCHVDIFIGDANDHGPVFQSQTYSAEINYNAIIGTSVVKVKATDADIGTNAISNYYIGESIIKDYLNVSKDGLVQVLESPIPAETENFAIPIIAVDSRNASLTATTTLELTLTGVPIINIEPTTEEQSGGSLSSGVVAGIAIACIFGTLLVVLLIVIIVRRGQPRHEPFEGDSVKYDTDTGALAGVGISNPMYSSGSAAAIENPTYAATGGGNIQDEEAPAKYGL